ncbi:ATP-binding protein [Marinobacter sp. BSs20148]|uniref:ATP-binding protein n=1 Tax=Marinobacter sp. BSs20148 TaxID=490759 RepID=UPI0002776BDB|nr:ATP-binding protein [Marinobacter sp. BSs20148]AFP29870.1 Sensor protein rstB [Marinobacter sp. BSs20148]
MPRIYFLKLYARLAGFVLLIAVLCMLLFQGLNGIRQQMWLEQHGTALMQWLAKSANPVGHYAWLVPAYNLEVVPVTQLADTAVIRERLGYGQVVVLPSSLGRRLLVAREDGQILGLNLATPYRDIVRASALVFRWHLDRSTVERRPETLRYLSASLGLGAYFIDTGERLPPADVLQQLARDGLVLYTGLSGEGPRVALQLADGEMVLLVPPPPFKPWSLAIILPLCLLLAAALALLLGFVARAWDGRLLKVESAALRIARGDLSARVELDSSALYPRLAKAFNSMAEHIHRLVQVQHDMIHAVSHELRTPVARIRFGVQMLADSEKSQRSEEQLQGIDDDIQELDDLIDEILTYARLEQSEAKFLLQQTSVPDLLRQVIAQQQLLHPTVVMELDVDGASEALAMAEVEPRHLHRAIQNLVGNAARYASRQVRVRCRLDSNNCRIDVEDDGPGIPRSDWDRVFIAFSRLDDSRTRTSGGYGLGLSIVRRIMYWHGGQAFVGISATLGGACFSLVWPRVQTQSGGLHRPAQEQNHPH